MATGNITSSDSYIEKTSKLIPAEALALFIALSSTAWSAATTPDDIKRYVVLAIAIVVGFGIVPLVLLRARKVTARSHYVISIVAFFLWVFNVQYDRLPRITDYHEMETLIGSMLLALFTFLAPWLAPQEDQ
jgi:hypothetical protein